MERTFVAIKPDAVQRGLIGEILQRFEKKGFKILGLKFVLLDRETAEKHYAEHVGKPFYEKLVKFITSGPIVVMVIKGKNAVEVSRRMMGATDPSKADNGTIRADYAQIMERNIIHGSDSAESAEREINIHFKESELVEDWHRNIRGWILE
ncbi:MAG TPA: nucleoside-diphosphate kinase [Cyanobacteria bacterium UBA9971]|nr:nucleoside-diphosphate kinase [Cyanobacteria bacterium UBA9971]